MVSGKQLPFSARVLIHLLLGITLVFILIVTQQLLIPLFFAILFAYALYPAADRLENWGLPRFLTNLFLILSSLLIIGLIVFGFALLINSFSEDLPQIQEQVSENLDAMKERLENSLGITQLQIDRTIENLQDFGQYLGQLFTATANTVLIIGLIPVYTFFILFYRNKFREFISRVFVSKYENIVQHIADQTAHVVPRYMKGLFVVCLILAFINSVGFYLIGIEYALLMGAIAAFFNLIPYLGTVIGYGIVFLFVIATQSPGLALAVAFQFLIVQFFENNILTPNITGSYVQINPLVTIFFLIAGGMVWGLPGMLMVIPYLAIVKIICENIPNLKPYSFLLGTRGTERYLVTWKDVKNKFGW